MKLGGSFISLRIGSGQNHCTETLGDIYVCKSKKEKFKHDKIKKIKSSKKKTRNKSANPRTLKAFISIVFNNNIGIYQVKIQRDKSYTVRPCERLIEELTHSTVGQSSEALLLTAKKIGEERLKKIIAED